MLEQPWLRSLTFLLQSYEKSFEEHASGLLFSTFFVGRKDQLHHDLSGLLILSGSSEILGEFGH